MKLALGTVQFGMNYGVVNQTGQISFDDGKKIVDFARGHGVDTLDTAIAYGDSEERLGDIGIQGWNVVSKLPAVPDSCNDISQWITGAVSQSLQRLKVAKLYGLLLHRPQQLLEQGGDRIYSALQQLKDEGVVKKIGVSIYAPLELDALCQRFQFDLVQAPFNALDRRLITTGWLSRLTDQGTEVHVRSVFLQGLLLMTSSSRPTKFERWAPLWSKWEAWLEHNELNPLQACLRYALSFPQISKVIVGVDHLQQFEEILAAAVGPLPYVPDDLGTDDLDLLNPANWTGLSNPGNA